jgi:hypothetical protein
MTVRDIQGHLADIYDIEVSADLISKITDAVLEEVKDWQSRPLCVMASSRFATSGRCATTYSISPVTLLTSGNKPGTRM